MPLEPAKLTDVQATQDEKWIRTYEATFDIWVPAADDPADYGVIAAGTAPGLPVVGTSYNLDGETDAWAFWTPYVKIARRNSGDPGERQVYQVKMKASNKPMDRDQTNKANDPLLEPPKISTNFTRFQKTPSKDVNNKAYENTNGEPLDGIQIDASRPVVNISDLNQINHNLSQIAEFMDCLNDATLFGLSAGKVKLSEHSMERLLYGINTYYFKHSFGFEIKFEGWKRKEINRGFWVYDSGGLVLNREGKNDPKITLLTNPGPGLGEATTTPVELEFDDYEEKDLSLLGIPTSF